MITAIFDLGPGDGGKGGVVHAYCNRMNAHTVIKVGGAQGSHGVDTGTHKFAFSQWGCGTFEGVNTFLSNRMVISPEGLLNEAAALESTGVKSPFDLLTCDESAICATPYHGIVSRLLELSTRDKPRGTVGTGVGEAYRYSLSHPELTISAKDLRNNLRKKLSAVRDYCIERTKDIGTDFLDDDVNLATEDLSLLYDDQFLDYNVERFLAVGLLLKIADDCFLKREIFDNDLNAVVESSHGVLTDNMCGLIPHVSAIRTLPSFTNQMLRDYGYTDAIESIGIHRAYSIRHGAGPLPTHDQSFCELLLPDSHKDNNRWQGEVRVGPLDFVLLRYALDICSADITGIAITWFDQIIRNGRWHICDEYRDINNNYFESSRRIKTGVIVNETFSDCLRYMSPVITELRTHGCLVDDLQICREIVDDRCGNKVSLVSYGPGLFSKQFWSL